MGVVFICGYFFPFHLASFLLLPLFSCFSFVLLLCSLLFSPGLHSPALSNIIDSSFFLGKDMLLVPQRRFGSPV